jgi:uncharacterized protein
MVESEGLAVFERLYAAFSRGDVDALADLLHEDVVWHTPGRGPFAGDHEGRDATLASFAVEHELSGGTYRVAVHDVLTSDDHTVAPLRATARRGDKTLDMDYALVFRIRQGAVAEAWELWADLYALDAFWS